MNNSNFLDTNNFKYLINFVFNDIQQKTNHDISNNKKYIGIFKKLVQTVHKKNMNKRVSKEYLNNVVIDKCVPFIIKQLNKEQLQNNSNTNYNNQPINISSRPLASRKPNTNSNNDFSYLTLQDDMSGQSHNIVDNLSGISSRNGEKIDFSSRMKDFQESRGMDDPRQKQNQLKSVNEIIGAQSNDEEKIDFAKKMQELQNERNYTNQNDSMVNFEQQNNNQNIKNHDALQNTNNQNVEIDNNFMEQLYENNKNADIDPNLLNKMSENYLNAPNEDEDNLINSYQNLELKIQDRAENNQLPTYDSNIDNLKIDYTSEKMSKNVENAEKELYQTTKKYNRNPAHLIVVSNETLIGGGDNITFQANLIEPIIIDKPADVFLEFLNLQNITGLSSGDPVVAANIETVNCFALKIDEFNTSTASNINELKDKYVIPNDSFGTTDNVADAGAATALNKVDATSYNIKLKSNYMCTINPMEISSLNISLYGLIDGDLNFLEGGGDGKVILGLFLKKHK
jgi:hypothetical protein